MTRYREAFTWTRSIDEFVQHVVTERPLLNVCAGRSSWGDVTLDLHEPADVQGDWTDLPFDDDSFEAVFADPPWDSGHKVEVAAYMREALRVAPVAYLMAPWLYCAAWAKITRVWWREFPGIHTPILLSRYERSRQMSLTVDEQAGSLVWPEDVAETEGSVD
jgi:hypothetical protein